MGGDWAIALVVEEVAIESMWGGGRQRVKGKGERRKRVRGEVVCQVEGQEVDLMSRIQRREREEDH